MRYYAGKGLEACGMAAVLFGLVIGLQHREALRTELIFLGLGAALFTLGYWLERPLRS